MGVCLVRSREFLSTVDNFYVHVIVHFMDFERNTVSRAHTRTRPDQTRPRPDTDPDPDPEPDSGAIFQPRSGHDLSGNVAVVSVYAF